MAVFEVFKHQVIPLWIVTGKHPLPTNFSHDFVSACALAYEVEFLGLTIATAWLHGRIGLAIETVNLVVGIQALVVMTGIANVP